MPQPTAAKVMEDCRRVCLNDAAGRLYNNEVLLPSMRVAFQELSELYQLHNVSITNDQEENFTIPIGAVDIGGPTGPALPQDFIEPIQLFERDSGSDEPFMEMTHREFLPSYTTPLQSIIFWTWQDQMIKFIPATSIRQIRIQFTASNFNALRDVNSRINVTNAQTFLMYRTSALVSDFKGEDADRASKLNTMAQLAADRLLGISAKGKQNITFRRKPFLAGWKRRGIYT